MVLPELIAAPDWRTIDFISDLHLQASEPATFAVWHNYMQTTEAGALFILGDLFEVWVGDDALQPGSFESKCVEVIRQTAVRLPVFFMHGNRDFLVGSSLMKACNAQLLDDPTVLSFDHERYVLSHGDAMCIEDTDYLAFRGMVRSSSWQQAFLAKPLAERQEIARSLRKQSDMKKSLGAEYADVDAQAARSVLVQANAATLIHGHTHKPAAHNLGSNSGKSLQRVVLSDWDAQALPARAEVLRLSDGGLKRTQLLK